MELISAAMDDQMMERNNAVSSFAAASRYHQAANINYYTTQRMCVCVCV